MHKALGFATTRLHAFNGPRFNSRVDFRVGPSDNDTNFQLLREWTARAFQRLP
jgi:hypothetical protein